MTSGKKTSLVRRMNRACAQRGLFQYIQPEHPPAAPDAFSSLKRKLEVHHQADLPDVFLSVPEAAALAGCTTSCIYNWISKGLIESHKHFARRGYRAKRRTKRWISYRSLSRFLWGRECVLGHLEAARSRESNADSSSTVP